MQLRVCLSVVKVDRKDKLLVVCGGRHMELGSSRDWHCGTDRGVVLASVRRGLKG